MCCMLRPESLSCISRPKITAPTTTLEELEWLLRKPLSAMALSRDSAETCRDYTPPILAFSCNA